MEQLWIDPCFVGWSFCGCAKIRNWSTHAWRGRLCLATGFDMGLIFVRPVLVNQDTLLSALGTLANLACR